MHRDGGGQPFGQHPPPGIGVIRVDDRCEGIHGIAVDEHVELDELVWLIPGWFVVHAAVAAGDGLELVMEIDENFVHRDAGGQHDVTCVHVFRIGADAALLHDQIHDVPDIRGGRHDLGVDQGLLDPLDLGGVREMDRVVHQDHASAIQVDLVNHARVGGDDVHVVFTAETFLNDFHVEESEKSATESEAEGGGCFRLVLERGVVELELGHAEFELFVVSGVDRIDAAEDHRTDFLESGKRFLAGIQCLGDGIPDFRIGGTLDVRDDIADRSGGKGILRLHFRSEDSDFLDFTFEAGAEEAESAAALEGAREDADVCDHSAVGVVDGVEDQGAGGGLSGTGWRRNQADDGLEDLGNADAFLGGDANGFLARDGENFLQLFETHGHIGGGEIDLVDDGDDA